MRERLDLKILTLVMVLLVIGILAGGITVLTIEKKNLASISGSSLESTADIIAHDIVRTMIEGKADVTNAMMQELKDVRGIEELAVIHYDGRHAFGTKTAPAETAVMKQITESRMPVQVPGVKKMTFYRSLENEDRCKATATFGTTSIEKTINGMQRASLSNDVTVMEEVKQELLKLDAATEEGARVLKAINENYAGFAAAADNVYYGIRG
jgi:phosphopantothenate synthetase